MAMKVPTIITPITFVEEYVVAMTMRQLLRSVLFGEQSLMKSWYQAYNFQVDCYEHSFASLFPLKQAYRL